MRRYCTVFERSETFNRFICIDNENAEEIKEILFRNEKYKSKFKYIVRRILETSNIYFNDYKRIENHFGIRVTEMRLFPNGDNCRIYCRELNLDGSMFCIIMVKILPKKKSMKLDKSIKQMIEALKNYEYEFEK